MNLEKTLPLLAVAFLLGAILELPWLIVFSVAVAALLLLATAWQKHALDRIVYRRKFRYRRGFPGESTSARIIVENRKLLPLSWLKTSDLWPFSVGPQNKETLTPTHLAARGQLINLYSLRWNERITRSLEIQFRKRGIYSIGPVELESGDFFGLFEASKQIEAEDRLTVFPDILPLEALHLPTDDPFGGQKAHRPLFDDPNLPIGVRPYQMEDDFRHVNWSATARTGSLQTRVYQPVTSRVLMVCMNVLTTSQPWLGTSMDLLEHLIKITATTVYHGVDQQYAVGLLSNGCLSHADHPFMIPPGRSPAQLGLLLESLAAVTPYVSAPFEPYLLKSLPQMAYGAALVIVTAFVNPALSETLLRLKRYRAHTTLISLEAAPPPQIPGVTCVHLPFEEK